MSDSDGDIFPDDMNEQDDSVMLTTASSSPGHENTSPYKDSSSSDDESYAPSDEEMDSGDDEVVLEGANHQPHPDVNAAIVASEQTDYKTGFEACTVAMSTTAHQRIREMNETIKLLKAHIQKLCTTNSEYRLALGAIVYACQQKEVELPKEALQMAGTLAPGFVEHAHRKIVRHAPSLARQVVTSSNFPIKLQMLNLPDTSTITSAIRFPTNPPRWPHAIGAYTRLGDQLVPLIETRARQIIEFGLYDPSQPDFKATETYLRQLCPNAATEIKFRLDLIFDESGIVVTNAMLTTKPSVPVPLSSPVVLGMPHTMSDGCVSIKITKLNALSINTTPRHRKFKYKLTCLDPALVRLGLLPVESPAFYAQSKLPKMDVAGCPTT